MPAFLICIPRCDRSLVVDMKMPYTRSGKCGGTVWQRNRYGAYCYPAFVPLNPRTPAQMAVRGTFGAVSARWRELTEEQRKVWCAAARTKWSKPRLCQKGRLTGILLFMKINVALANRGLAQLDLPPGYGPCPQPAVPGVFGIASFDQPTVGPTLFLQGNRLLKGREGVPRKWPARQPA